MTTTETLIIGAGLTGLTAAYELHKAGKPFLLIEARDRIGGRILTSRTDGGAALELGATWLGKKHQELISLLSELGIGVFEQVTGGRAIYEAISTSPPQVVQLPHNDEPSYRIAGGSEMFIRELRSKILSTSVRLDEAVLALKGTPDYVEVTTAKGVYHAGIVISTLPPHLFTSKIQVSPALPSQLLNIAQQTHTWMGESIKVGLRYAKPFWREDGAPGGTIFSNVGPVSEMYDHTNIEESKYALKGFLNSAYHSLTREERRDMVLTQLRKYFGDVVDDYLAYEEGVWRQEPYTFVPYASHVLPHQHNGHPIFRDTYLDGRLLLAGSETAVVYPGYMDGAVRSGKRVALLV
ncbi:flavin monoamine oxidase family protein [Neolewinella persica]|uniref:flavin monoamine oxidase family protein n=1 Tax=Neolewinella persica TaxID=70998 RepID=UPI000382D731|nr:FAD-dependent oxidoreductase [Neolewinella persica]